jgi:predicted murein hydrolase (TIGR00659 family)
VTIEPFRAWVFLASSPLFWLALTLGAYLVGDALAARSGRHPLVNPVLIAILVVGSVLVATGTDYRTYFEGAQFVHVLLGPATVALAVPIARHRAEIRRNLVPLLVALVIGAAVGVVSAVGFAALLGASPLLLASIAPKSVTAAIAMGVSQETGGQPALTAVLVIATGVLGAVTVTPLMNALRISDYRARGLAVGVAAHGIGTARAFAVNAVAGTFASLGMALNGLATALLVPLVLAFAR